MKYDVAMTESLHRQICDDLLNHLRRGVAQEELRFALWRPGTGAKRQSALVFEVIQPEAGDLELHGNASFDPSYLTRAVRIAYQKKVGLAFMHNHLTAGWQGMSEADIIAERDRISPPARATGLPLVGMTLGTDGNWSARVWTWDGNRFNRKWCDKVRVVGRRLQVTFNDKAMAPPARCASLRRTIDTWGGDCQDDLARLRVGVIGVGSVGAMVAESLARMGIQDILLVDPDRVELHNLDRLLHARRSDVGKYKAPLTAKWLRDCATAEKFNVDVCTSPVEHEETFRKVLDCDLLFSAVDRPLPKDLLNRIAYTHCIPVISGGVFVDNKPDGSLGQASWSVTSVGPECRCLRCDGQYTSSDVVMDRDGSLDDPAYIQRLWRNGQAIANQNVFPFSANLASLMVIEMVRLVIAADWWPTPGGKIYYNLVPSRLTRETESCERNCSIHESTVHGDSYSYPFIIRGGSWKSQPAVREYPGSFMVRILTSLFKRDTHGKDK